MSIRLPFLYKVDFDSPTQKTELVLIPQVNFDPAHENQANFDRSLKWSQFQFALLNQIDFSTSTQKSS